MPWTGNVLEETIAASAARTANGSAVAGENYGTIDDLRVQLDVTAASGTSPTLDVVVEDSVDGTNWNTVGTFAQKTAAGREVITVSDLIGTRLRVRWTVGGTSPSFTFSVKAVGEA